MFMIQALKKNDLTLKTLGDMFKKSKECPSKNGVQI